MALSTGHNSHGQLSPRPLFKESVHDLVFYLMADFIVYPSSSKQLPCPTMHVLTPAQMEVRSEWAVSSLITLHLIFWFFLFSIFILHTNQSFSFLLSSYSHPSPLFSTPHLVLFHLYSYGGRPPVRINKAWHIKLRKDQAPLPCIKGFTLFFEATFLTEPEFSL